MSRRRSSQSTSPASVEDEAEETAPLPIRRLLGLARPEWKRLVAGTVALLVATGMGLLFPIAIGRVVDAAVGSTRSAGTEALDRWALILAGVAVAQSIFVFLRYYLYAIAGERIVCDLRGNVYAAILEQEVAFFDEEGTGQLQSRLSSDTGKIQGAVTEDLGALLSDSARVLFGLITLGWLSIDLTLWMIATVPPVAIGAVLFGRRISKLSKRVQDALAEAGDVVQESVSSVRTVRSFGAETREIGRYRASIERVFQVSRDQTIAISMFGGVAWLAGFGAVGLVFWFGGRKVVAGEMEIGDLVAFLILTITVASAFAGLASLWGSFMRAGGASKRVFEILDRSPSIPLEGGSKPIGLRGEVRFEDVHFSYPSRADSGVLSGASFELSEGEIVALVGPSGSGKSTISALMLRLYDPTQGRVLFGGYDLRDLDPTWLRKSIGIVSQEPLLFTGTIEDNVRYGRPEATASEVAAACTAAHMDEFTQAFEKGLQTEVGERGVQLSGGQKQRVAIARAILKNPPLLILDEATSALDSASEAAVQAALTELVHTRTTLIIAHRESTIRDAQRVLLLQKGQIAPRVEAPRDWNPDHYESDLFGDSPEMADELGRLIFEGKKTATCSALWQWEAEGDDPPEVGKRSVVRDGKLRPLCIIELTEVSVRPYSQIDDEWARAEGEGNLTLESWRAAHWEFFSRMLPPLGHQPTLDMNLVCERFRVVHRFPLPPAGPCS